MDKLKGLLKYIDIKGILMEYLMKEIVEPKVRELVQKSDNTLDDMLAELVLAEVKKYGAEKIDELLADLNKSEPAA